jgi:hypothetical protein
MMLEGPKEYQREKDGEDRGAAPQSVAGQPVKLYRKRNGFV